jgi:hypothetical protein
VRKKPILHAIASTAGVAARPLRRWVLACSLNARANGGTAKSTVRGKKSRTVIFNLERCRQSVYAIGHNRRPPRRSRSRGRQRWRWRRPLCGRSNTRRRAEARRATRRPRHCAWAQERRCCCCCCCCRRCAGAAAVAFAVALAFDIVTVALALATAARCTGCAAGIARLQEIFMLHGFRSHEG